MRDYPGEQRGLVQQDWLQSRHSFSFGSWYHPERMGYGTLRVINEDWIAPAQGFGMHGHQDMEIVTYMLDGALAHRDSLGNGATLRPGMVQRMSAGSGIRHSEFNPSATEVSHLLQIWLLPNQTGITPEYEERPLEPGTLRGDFRLLLSPQGEYGAMCGHSDTRLYVAWLQDAEGVSRTLSGTEIGYLHLARGTVRVNDRELNAGDALYLGPGEAIRLEQVGPGRAEVLLFTMPA